MAKRQRIFTQRQLRIQDMGPLPPWIPEDMGSLPPSVPLVMPKYFDYDIATNQLFQTQKRARRPELVWREEALRLLCSLDKPVAVLSVCGLQHTGKSYLLSRLLGTDVAFQVPSPTQIDPTEKPVTRGIWMSTIVFDCEDFALVLLDTEGIDFDLEDPRMFVITTLLSSYLVYNSLQLPPAAVELKEMSPFTKLSTLIQLQHGKPTDPDDVNFRDHFPDFLWVTYDSHVKPTDPVGREISPTEYLKTRVLVKPSPINTVIHILFPTVECIVLPKRTAEYVTVKTTTIHEEQLTPEFLSAVDNLLKHIQHQIQPKHGFTSRLPVDGSTLALLTKEYVNAMNLPNKPCLESVWHAVVDQRYKAIVDNLLSEYTKEMEEGLYKENKLPFNLEGPGLRIKDVAVQKPTLMEVHYRILSAKVEALVDKARHLLPPEGEEEPAAWVKKWAGLQHEFKKEVAKYATEETDGKQMKVVKGGILQHFVEENERQSFKQCTQLLKHLSAAILDRIHSDQPYTYEDFTKDLIKLEADYLREVAGPAKWDALLEMEEELAEREKELERIQGFVRDVFREHQQNCIKTIKQNRANEQNAAQKSQVWMHKEFKLQQLKTLKNEQAEAIKRMIVSKQNQIDLEKRKHGDLNAAGIEDAAFKTEAKLKAVENLYDRKIAKLQDSDHELEESIKRRFLPALPSQEDYISSIPGICAVM